MKKDESVIKFGGLAQPFSSLSPYWNYRFKAEGVWWYNPMIYWYYKRLNKKSEEIKEFFSETEDIAKAKFAANKIGVGGWNSISVEELMLPLVARFIKTRSFNESLIATGDRELVYIIPSEKWLYENNRYGKMLMYLRSTEMDKNVS